MCRTIIFPHSTNQIIVFWHRDSVKWYHITSRVSFLFTALSHWYPHIIFNTNNYCCGKFLFFLSYSLTRHENSLEIFLHDAPSTPEKLSKLIPLPNGKFYLFHGGGMNIFWNHTMIVWFLAGVLSKVTIHENTYRKLQAFLPVPSYCSCPAKFPRH